MPTRLNRLLRLTTAAAAALLAAGPLPAADPAPSTDKLNRTITNVTLADLTGKPAPLFDGADARARVVVFLSFDCPVSNHYATQLSALSRDYAAKGVAVTAVLPSDDAPADLARRAAEFKLPFPVFLDPKLAAADAFKAVATPEAFVLDGKNVLRYRGRIDNAFSARLKQNPKVTDHDLTAALDAVLAGTPVATPATRAVGCPMPLRDAVVKADAGVTYHRDVRPILQANCQSCHRAGAVAPFALTTYKQAVSWAGDIKDYTADKRMPPWKPSAGVPFRNDRALSAKDTATLAKWVDAGCPEGDAKDAPKPATFPTGWQLGEPDLILSPAEDMHVAATGGDLFRCFVLKTGLTEDKYIVAYEVQPGNAQVVHHTLNFFDTTGGAAKLAQKETVRPRKGDEADRGPGYPVGMGIGFIPSPSDVKPGIPPLGTFGGWAPGQLATKYPEGAGSWLPKEADVVMQVHYHRTGKAETDRPRIGLYFAKKEVKRPWQTITVGGMSPFSSIPANKVKSDTKGSVWLTTEADVHSVMPHMHLIGKSIAVTVTPPDGPGTTLVAIKEWDYNWQETYWLKEPLRVKPGTRIDVEAVYDNTAGNPRNPFTPPQRVWFGEQTTNEMLFAFVGVTPTGKDRVRVQRVAPKGVKAADAPMSSAGDKGGK